MSRGGKLISVGRVPPDDLLAWQQATDRGTILDESGAAARWSEASQRSVWNSYRRWLGWLAETDDRALTLGVAERCTPARVRAFVDTLQKELSPGGIHNYVHHLLMALRVMAPDHDWDWLDQVSRNLSRVVPPKYKRDRMQPLETLLDLGFRLMASADGGGRPADRALHYRDGLIIALLVCCPLRRRNLAMMRIDRHLARSRTGYLLLFEANETKMRTPIEVALPDWMSEPIDRYLRDWRPLIHGADRHHGLWASAKGVSMRPEAIYDRVCRHTAAAFGRSVNPHLFRDCVATTIALDEPARIGVASAILGHTNPETTRHYYVQAETVAATRVLQETVRALRANVARP